MLTKSIARLSLSVLILSGIISLQNHHIKKSSSRNIASQEKLILQEQAKKAQINLVKELPAFGFDNLVADWAFLQFIQYYGDTDIRQQTGYSIIPDYFETIVNRDPRFVDAYRYLSPANSIYAGRPDKTIAFLEKVTQSISPELSPNTYMIWSYKGVDEVLFLGDTKAAQRSYEMAAKWASLQSDPIVRGFADRLEETAEFLATNPDSRQIQAASWAMILHNTSDESTRRIAINRIEALGGEVRVKPDGTLSIKLPEKDYKVSSISLAES